MSLFRIQKRLMSTFLLSYFPTSTGIIPPGEHRKSFGLSTTDAPPLLKSKSNIQYCNIARREGKTYTE